MGKSEGKLLVLCHFLRRTYLSPCRFPAGKRAKCECDGTMKRKVCHSTVAKLEGKLFKHVMLCDDVDIANLHLSLSQVIRLTVPASGERQVGSQEQHSLRSDTSCSFPRTCWGGPSQSSVFPGLQPWTSTPPGGGWGGAGPKVRATARFLPPDWCLDLLLPSY